MYSHGVQMLKPSARHVFGSKPGCRIAFGSCAEAETDADLEELCPSGLAGLQVVKACQLAHEEGLHGIDLTGHPPPQVARQVHDVQHPTPIPCHHPSLIMSLNASCQPYACSSSQGRLITAIPKPSLGTHYSLLAEHSMNCVIQNRHSERYLIAMTPTFLTKTLPRW